MKMLIAILLLAPSLRAVTPVFDEPVDHRLELKSAEVRLRISRVDDEFTATATTTFVVVNAGEDELDAHFRLPHSIVPEGEREGFKLEAAEAELPEHSLEDGNWRWQVTLAPAQRLQLSWTCTIDVPRMPQDHPLVHRFVRVPFQYVRGFARLPDEISVEVRYDELPHELFGRSGPPEGGAIQSRIEVRESLPNAEFRFFERTPADMETRLRERLDGFDEEQMTADNRSYTDTLVHLYDVLKLRGDQPAMAEVCAMLAELEEASGRALTLCGPWARWRSHVPWVLCRFASLRETGANAEEAAEDAVAVMKVRWPVYLAARDERRPYDHFDAAKYGNYWDYDWDRTRELYAEALALLGQEARAQDVRESGDDG